MQTRKTISQSEEYSVLLAVRVASMHNTCRPNRAPVRLRYDRHAIQQAQALRALQTATADAEERAKANEPIV